MTETPSASGGESRLALTAGFGCYFIWGFMPLAMQAVAAQGAGAWEILAHRIAWSIPIAAVLVVLAGQTREAAAVFVRPKVLGLLALSSVLIACNWLVFTWAVLNGRTLETSLGYYINPLVNMAAGALLFRERIDRLGKIAIGLAAVGVTVQALALGHVPWISLFLALSFGGYGIVRKMVAADAQTGLLIECLVFGLPGIVFILWLEHSGQGHFLSSGAGAAWLIFSGVITAVPLVLFSWAARRMPLSAMGFLQFLAPTMSFVIGVSQGEPFTPLRALSFVFIWLGAAVFIYGAWSRSRRARSAPTPA